MSAPPRLIPRETPGATRGARIVDKIHTLRGEYFRHTTRNERRTFQAKTYNSPTLPKNLLADSESPEPPPSLSPREALFVSKRPNRPKPDPPPEPQTPAELLSLILPSANEPNVPRLSLVCLQILIKSYSLSDDVLSFIPTHLRLDLLRWAATHHPLTNSELDALCGRHGHVAGELIIVGPNASVREDQFEPLQPSEEWEEEEDPAPLIHTFILASSHLSPSIHLPATLTRLGLVNILTPVNVLNRLPTTCPLLEHLDLSFNVWLVAEKEARERLGKIPWSRWHHLQQLGVRKCYFAPDMIEQVNRGRWDDVTIVN
ncbi:hypothetical protein FB45DRAFT_791908 [Roridomyces roridus]|uniref:Uncharacterized protein n=1 Tax=Roridomyces roridus TaxID=1738132 RepID=A0AAD7BX01_9AGAR|nr:hypothetical protein FB45DRAFT_791908 [Roridomyces roridus]